MSQTHGPSRPTRARKNSYSEGPDGLETKRTRTCGLEVNDDPHEEDARPEDDEWATDGLSGEFIDDSEFRAARKEETEFMSEIELCEGSSAEDCWSSTGKPPVSTKWIDSKKGEGVGSHLVVRDFTATRTGLTCSHPHRRWT